MLFARKISSTFLDTLYSYWYVSCCIIKAIYYWPRYCHVRDMIPPLPLHRETKVSLVTPEVMEDQEIR